MIPLKCQAIMYTWVTKPSAPLLIRSRMAILTLQFQITNLFCLFEFNKPIILAVPLILGTNMFTLFFKKFYILTPRNKT